MFLSGAVLAAHANTLVAQFVFDGIPLLIEYPLVKQLWPPAFLWGNSRPLGWATLAVNYALCGREPFWYAAVNLAIHLANTLLLFGIVWQTLRLPRWQTRYASDATMLAFLIALLWGVHPLQTQSVAYLYQRFESQASLFYLAALFSFILSSQPSAPRGLAWLALAACLGGILTKEVAATAPLCLLWYDRAFLSPSWRELRKKRGSWHLLYLSVLLVPVLLIWSLRQQYIATGIKLDPGLATHLQNGEVRLTPWTYLLNQGSVILHYIELAFWPARQCFDYQWPLSINLWQVGPPFVAVGLLVMVVLWLMVRHPPLGFVAGMFFLLLAPTSSIVPIIDLAFEHRMYLPLACLCVLVVIGGNAALQFLSERRPSVSRLLRVSGLGLCLLAALILGMVTSERIRVYDSEMATWRDVVAKAPYNVRGLQELLRVYGSQSRHHEALALATKARESFPVKHIAEYLYALALMDAGQFEQAVPILKGALAAYSNFSAPYNDLGIIAEKQGQPRKAVEYFYQAVRIWPDNDVAWENYCKQLVATGQIDEALKQYERFNRRFPDRPRVLNDYGVLLKITGNPRLAIKRLQQAVTRDPAFKDARYNLALAFLATQEPEKALPLLEKLVEKPVYPGARFDYAMALMQLGRYANAISELQQLIAEEPNHDRAHGNLALLFAQLGWFKQALHHGQQVAAIIPDKAAPRCLLARLALAQQDKAQALKYLNEALRLQPDDPEARQLQQRLR